MKVPLLLFSLIITSSSQASELSLSWQWRSTSGQQQHLVLVADEQALSANHLEMERLEAALHSPLETLYAYISPRLYNSIHLINQAMPDNAPKLQTLEQAFTLHDDSAASILFWQAYQQYQEDAFYQMKVTPCIHPTNQTLPCVRPDYSQLFYHFKSDLKPLAHQFVAKDLASSISLLQEWLGRIPTPPEQVDHFSPPLQALRNNQADSDERALLMASLLAELAPQYMLSIIYPHASVGSVSPAWLAISADSGIPGDVLEINHQHYILLNGSPLLARQMLLANVPLISEPLY